MAAFFHDSSIVETIHMPLAFGRRNKYTMVSSNHAILYSNENEQSIWICNYVDEPHKTNAYLQSQESNQNKTKQ